MRVSMGSCKFCKICDTTLEPELLSLFESILGLLKKSVFLLVPALLFDFTV